MCVVLPGLVVLHELCTCVLLDFVGLVCGFVGVNCYVWVCVLKWLYVGVSDCLWVVASMCGADVWLLVYLGFCHPSRFVCYGCWVGC